MGISIHAPLAGSDVIGFESAIRKMISIHAPLAGSDELEQLFGSNEGNFNPRSPRGERR